MRKGSPSLRLRVGAELLKWAWPRRELATVHWREVAEPLGADAEKLSTSDWEFREGEERLSSKDCGPIQRCVREVLAEFLPEQETGD